MDTAKTLFRVFAGLLILIVGLVYFFWSAGVFIQFSVTVDWRSADFAGTLGRLIPVAIELLVGVLLTWVGWWVVKGKKQDH